MLSLKKRRTKGGELGKNNKKNQEVEPEGEARAGRGPRRITRKIKELNLKKRRTKGDETGMRRTRMKMYREGWKNKVRNKEDGR